VVVSSKVRADVASVVFALGESVIGAAIVGITVVETKLVAATVGLLDNGSTVP